MLGIQAFCEAQKTLHALYDGEAWLDYTGLENGLVDSPYVAATSVETLDQACDTVWVIYRLKTGSLQRVGERSMWRDIVD